METKTLRCQQHVSHVMKSYNSTLLTVCSSWHLKGTYCLQLQHKAVFEAKALVTTRPVTQHHIPEGACFLLQTKNIPNIFLETQWLQLASTKFCSFLSQYGILAWRKSLHKEMMAASIDMQQLPGIKYVTSQHLAHPENFSCHHSKNSSPF